MSDLDLVRALASAADYLAVFAVTRPDGSIHASLVKAGILDDPLTGEASVGVVVAGSTRKLPLLRLAGRAAVVFQRDGRWVGVEGHVRLYGPDEPPLDSGPVSQILRDVFTAAGGTHDDWEEFDQVMADERRCAVLIAPERMTSNG